MNNHKRLTLAIAISATILLVFVALFAVLTHTPPLEPFLAEEDVSVDAAREDSLVIAPSEPDKYKRIQKAENASEYSAATAPSEPSYEQPDVPNRSMAMEAPEEMLMEREMAMEAPEEMLMEREMAMEAPEEMLMEREMAMEAPLSLSRSASEPSDEQLPDWSAVPLETEVWIITKAPPPDEPGDVYIDSGIMACCGEAEEEPPGEPDDDYADSTTPGEDVPDPGSGALVARIVPDDEVDGAEQVPLPLQHTAVDADIAGHISTVRVKQQFTNPFDTKIEAVYVFPLPQKAAVSEFLMVIGARTIRGILREKEEAEAIYRAARDQGYQASLLVQHRPNVFEQKVANIEPGKAIDVDITYFNTLAYKDGWYSFVFPTVVGPRFNPPGHPDPVHALPRGAGAATPGGTAVTYLTPTERSGHDLSISVHVDAGVAIDEFKSTHEITVERDGPASATVQLAKRTTIPNRDFVLDLRVAGEAVKSNLLTYRDPETGEGFFSLMMIPPVDSIGLSRRPMEMVFVIDCSGSMEGRPLAQAKQAIATALGLLNPEDTFQIIRFSEDASQFGREPVPATEENLAAARRYLANLNSQGGTMMVEGIKAALDFPHNPSRYRFVSFMTDGYIGNEAEILAEVHRRIGNARIFSFGVGESVNRYLMERMAKIGRGAVAYLGLNDSAEEVMGAFFERVSRAALTDVGIDWGEMAVSDLYPGQLPDLFVGRPLTLSGRFQGEPAPVTVSATTADGAHRAFMVETTEAGAGGASIAKVWARANIAALADRQAVTGDPHGELGDAILRVALQHRLSSNYTSFVAVDSSERTEGEYGVTVQQAVPVPRGVRYETTVE